MQLEAKFNGKIRLRNKEFLNKKKKKKRGGKRAYSVQGNKLPFHQRTSAHCFRKWQTFFDITYSVCDPSTALNHLNKLKTAQ